MNDVTKLTPQARSRIMDLVHAMIAIHPEAAEVGSPFGCPQCKAVRGVMTLLDMDQRRTGPAFEEALVVLR